MWLIYHTKWKNILNGKGGKNKVNSTKVNYLDLFYNENNIEAKVVDNAFNLLREQLLFQGEMAVCTVVKFKNKKLFYRLEVGNEVPSYIFIKYDLNMKQIKFYITAINILGDGKIKKLLRKIPLIKYMISVGVVELRASNCSEDKH